MVFWGLAAALTALSLALTMAPMLRGSARADRRSSYDMQIYRDQLREVEADRSRGLLNDEEAEATRIEISRRLLALADGESDREPKDAATARMSRGIAAATILGAAALTALLYVLLGAPGVGDQPLTARLQSDPFDRPNQPRQEEIEAAMAAESPETPRSDTPAETLALVARLETALADRPDDLEGHQLLARSLAATGQFRGARAAQERVVAILGDAVAPRDLIDLGELMVLAARGYVSPEAARRIAEGLEGEPENPVGRYYSGLALLQAGRPDLAYPIWRRLLEEGPPDAPWVLSISGEIAEVARLAGVQQVTNPAGPSREDIEAAEEMAPADRLAMIETMVSNLSERLATDGGPPEEWAQLIRSLVVLDRDDEAGAILAEARTAFADRPSALSLLDEAARELGLSQ